MNGSFSGFDMSILGSVLATQFGYAPGAGQQTGASAGATANRKLSAAQLAALPPWDSRQPKVAQAAEVRKILAAKSILDPGSASLKNGRLSVESDIKKLFTVHKAMDRLQTLSEAAARTGISGSEKKRITDRFNRGMKELDEYMTRMKMHKVDLIKGRRNDNLETEMFKAASGVLRGENLSVSNPTVAVADFANAPPFDMAITTTNELGDPVTTTLTFDFDEMGTTIRSLDNVAGYMNSKLAAEGFDTRIRPEYKLDLNTGTYGWGLTIQRATGEDISFPNSAGTTGPVPGGNLIVNSDFSVNSAPAGQPWSFEPTRDGWTSTTGFELTDYGEGRWALDTDNGGDYDSYSTQMQTEAGKAYDLTFDYRRKAMATDAASAAFEVVWNGNVVGTFTQDTAEQWLGGKVSVIGTGGNDTLTIRELASGNTADAQGSMIANLRLQEAMGTAPTRNLSGNLATNGSFEINTLNGATFVEGPLSGWTTLSNGSAQNYTSGDNQINVAGNQPTRLGSDGTNAFVNLDGAVRQSLQTQTGATYQIDFATRAPGSIANGNNLIEVRWNNQVVATIDTATDTNWRARTLDVTGTGGSDTLEFRSVGGDLQDSGSDLDGVQIRQVLGTGTPPPAGPAAGVDVLGGAGRFENPNLTNSIQRLNSFEGWNATGAGAFLIDGTNQWGLGMDPAGQIVELSGPNQVLSRSVNTVAGQNYRLSLDYSKGDSGVVADARFEVLWNGQVVGTFSPADADWETRQLNVTGTGGADTLAFRSLNTTGSSNDGAWIDNVTLEANPTPTGANLMGNGSFESGLTGWTQSGIGLVNDATRASNGTQTTLMSSANNGPGWSLSTNVAGTTAGQAYALEFDYGAFGTVGSGPEAGMRAIVRDAGGNVLASRDFYDSTQQNVAPAIYQKGRIDFAATGSNVTVQFVDINSGDAITDSMMLDNVSVRAIPGAVSPPPPPPPTGNILVNGSFEATDIATDTWAAVNTPGWTGITNSTLELQEFSWAPASAGAQNAELSNGGFKQTVNTQAGQNYQLSFAAQHSSDGTTYENSFEVWWNGSKVADVNPVLGGGWNTTTLNLTGTGGAADLEFRMKAGALEGAMIDNVQMVAGAPVSPPPPPPPPPPGVAQGTEMLVNGSFDTFSNQVWDFGTFSDAYQDVQGWTSTADDPGAGLNNVFEVIYTTETGATNGIDTDFGNGAGDSFSQSVQTEAGRTYDLTFDYNAKTAALASNPDSAGFEVLWNGTVVGRYTPGDTSQRTGALQVTGTGGQDSLTFREIGTSDGHGSVIAAVSLKAGAPVTGPLGGNLVSNGSFESDDIATNSFQYMNATGWTGITGSQTEIQDSWTPNPGTGQQYMELMNGGARQSITTVAGQTYQLDFASRFGNDGTAQSNAFEVWYNGSKIADVNPVQGQPWQNNTFTFTGAGGPANLEFRMKPGQENAEGAFIDGVQVRQVMGASPPPPVNLIQNGSFEVLDGNPGWTTVGDSQLALTTPTGWTSSAGNLTNILRSGTGNYASNGQYSLEIDAENGVDSLSQSVQTVAGQVYDLRFDTRLGPSTAPSTADMEVLWNGAVIGLIRPNSQTFETQGFQVVGTGGNDTLTFRELAGQNNSMGAVIDNVRLTAASGVSPPPPSGLGANLVSNSGFEADDIATGSFSFQNVTGWTGLTASQGELRDEATSPEGQQNMELMNGGTRQTINTEAGKVYQLDFMSRSGWDGTPASHAFEVWYDGKMVADINPTSPWQNNTFTFNGAGRAADLEFRMKPGQENAQGAMIDNVRVREIFGATPPPPVAPGTNIITNGSFEGTDVATNSSADVTQAGWTTLLGTNSGRVDTLDYSGAPDGSQYAELDEAGGYKTTLNTELGRTYTLDFDFKNNANGSVTDNQFEVWWNGSKIGDYGPGAGQGWTNGQLSIVGTGGAGSLEFRTKTNTSGMSNFNGAHIDDVKLIAGALPGGNSWGANLVANGSFENYGGAGGWVNNGANMASTEVAGFFGQLAGWSGNSSGGTGSGGDLIRGSAGAPLGTDGNVVVELDGVGGPNVDGLSQSVQTTAGTQYRLQFDLSRYNNVSSSSSGVEVVWNGQVVGTATPSATNGQWNTATFYVTGTGGNDTFQLREVGSQNDGGGALIDNVRLQANLGSGAPSGPPSADIASRTYGSNLIQDGGFEALPNSFNALTGTSPWQSNDGEVEIWGAAVTSGYGYAAAPQGSQFLELDKGGELNEVYQDVTTEAGKTYQLDFNSLGRSSAPSGVSNTLEVLWNDEVIGTVTSAADGTWDTSRFDVIGTGGTDRLTFRETAGGNDSLGPFIDNVRLREVTNAPVDNPNDGPGILGMNGAAWGQGGSMRVVDMTSAKAGDKFSIQVNDKKERTFTITNTMTLRDLAAQIQREMGTAGTARVEMGPKGWRIDMDPKKGNRVEVFAGSVKGNALDDLGLAEGVARKIGTAKDSKRAAFVSGIAGGQTISRGDGVNGVFRGAKGVNAKAIAALEFDPTLRIDEKEGAKAAIESLESSMRKVRLAYRQVNGELDKLASGAPQPVFSAREAARMAQYQSALNKLQAGPSTSMLFSGV